MEIERKFLVDTRIWRPTTNGVKISQGYLSSDKERIVRVRLAGDEAFLTVKGKVTGISRKEFEYSIPMSEAMEMMSLCIDAPISKTRYEEKHGEHIWEIDVFEGENSGLVLAEIELDEESESFTPPAWLGTEVSMDFRYANASLLSNPYSKWMK